MRRWFYIQDGERVGPIEEEEFFKMCESGAIAPETMVWTKELEEWTEAERIEGLIPDDLQPPPMPSEKKPYPPPQKASLGTPSSNKLYGCFLRLLLGRASLGILSSNKAGGNENNPRGNTQKNKGEALNTKAATGAVLCGVFACVWPASILIVLSPFGIFFGIKALRLIKANGTKYGGKNRAIFGICAGSIALVLFVVLVFASAIHKEVEGEAVRRLNKSSEGFKPYGKFDSY